MATFPFLPMMAIMASTVSLVVVQINVVAYAGFMVEHLGVVDDKDKAGYYAGLLSAAFMIGRVCSSHFWGVVVDRWDRRFIMLFGTVSTMTFSVVFGCSTTFTMAFVSRFLTGLLNGVTVVSRTLVSEICTTKKHETIGMGVITTAWTAGTVLGPGIGGLLAEPAKHYPGTFSEHGIFGRYPYLLPNVLGSGLGLLALPLVFLFVKDAPSAQSGDRTPKAWRWSWCVFGGGVRDDNVHGNDDLVGPDSGGRSPSWMQTEMAPATNGRNGSATGRNGSHQSSGSHAAHTTHERKQESLLAQGHIRVLVFVNGIYSLVFSGFDEVYPLWALSSTAKGGLGWSSPQIGKVFVAGGLMVLAFDTLAVPYLTPLVGVQISQRVSSVFEVPVYLLLPLICRVNGNDLLGFVLSVLLLFTCYVCSNAFMLAVALAVNNAAVSSRRAELNGLSLTVESVARLISPVVCSALFAFSINGDHAYPFEYHLVFYLLGSIRLVAALTGWNRITDNGNME